MSKEKREKITITEDDYIELNPNNPIVNGLNEDFERAKKKPGLMPVFPIEGLTGSGKSSIVRAWLKENHIVNKFQRLAPVTDNIATFDLEKTNFTFMKANEGWLAELVTRQGEQLYSLQSTYILV